jgi:hypothetical protein
MIVPWLERLRRIRYASHPAVAVGGVLGRVMLPCNLAMLVLQSAQDWRVRLDVVTDCHR